MNIVAKFMDAVFDSIVQRRQQRVLKAMEKDPELKRLYLELNKVSERMAAHVEQLTNQPGMVSKGEKVVKNLFDH